jgi:hypothetical protein
MGCSLACYFTPSIPDGPLDQPLQSLVVKSMIEHGESSNKGNRLENCQRCFPLPDWFGSRPYYFSRSVLPYGNIPVTLGIPDFPDDRFCRKHGTRVRECRCRVSRCRSVQNIESGVMGGFFRNCTVQHFRIDAVTCRVSGRCGVTSGQEGVRCRIPCHSSIPGCLNRQ